MVWAGVERGGGYAGGGGMKCQRCLIRLSTGFLFAWGAILVPSLVGKELPDAPAPKVEAAPKRVTNLHTFYGGRETRITIAVEVAAWGADMAATCRNFGQGGKETVLPAYNCAQVIGWTAAFHAAGEGLAYLLHATGHHRLEQVPRWYLTGGNLYGAAYTAAHYHHRPAPLTCTRGELGWSCQLINGK